MTLSKLQSEAVKENWICKLFGHKEFEIFTYSVGTKDNKIHKMCNNGYMIYVNILTGKKIVVNLAC